MAVTVIVVVILLGTDVLHLVDAAALGAPLNGALTGHTEPDDVVGVSGDTSATGELLLAGGADENGVGECAEARGIKRAHVEDVNALHLAENFETLETSRLLDIGRDGAGGGTGAEKVVNGLDLLDALDLGIRNGVTAHGGGGQGTADSRGDGNPAGDREGGALQEHGVGFRGVGDVWLRVKVVWFLGVAQLKRGVVFGDGLIC